MPLADSGVDWTNEAEKRLQRVPAFLRRMVRRRAEDYVRGEGRFEVEADDLKTLARRRFGEAGPPRPEFGGGEFGGGRGDA